MKLRAIIWYAGILLGTGLSGCFTGSCNRNPVEGMIAFTRVPVNRFDPGTEPAGHNHPGSQIVAIDPDCPVKSEKILTGSFYSACSPSISYDGNRMLFLAQENQGDNWQLWEMDLRTNKATQITGEPVSCSDPAYLPGDRVVYSKELTGAATEAGNALFVMRRDGCCPGRITFQPHEDFTTTILQDGRILMRSQQLYPGKGHQMYLAMRPNGTKAELFYRGSEQSMLNHRAVETKAGRVYFIEWEQGPAGKADVVSVHQDRPLFTKTNHTEGIEGDFYSVLPRDGSELLVSHLPPGSAAAGLYRFNIAEGTITGSLMEYADYHIFEPVPVAAYERPRHLPDEVNKKETTGQLFCQNINITADCYHPDPDDPGRATKIEVLGAKKSLGIVPVEEDGTFYLKVKADMPFRIQTLNDKNEVVSGPSGWLWLRPFERRGCVGCHEDPELVPENIQPLAVKKPPVVIPVEESGEPELGSAVKISE